MENLFDERDTIQVDNQSTRIPVVLCLDTSESMVDNGGFDGLNEGVRAFYDTCKKDSVNKYGFDVAIVTFGRQGVEMYQDFHPIWNDDNIPNFSFNPHGDDGTPLGRGIDLAMKGLQHRKDEYHEHHKSYYQPWLVIITDGIPTDDGHVANARWYEEVVNQEEYEAYNKVKDEVLGLQEQRKLNVIAVGVGNDDFSKLAEFVIDNKVLVSQNFNEFDLFFEFMSKSMSVSTSKITSENQGIDSPLSMIKDDLEDEGVSISIEDFGKDED